MSRHHCHSLRPCLCLVITVYDYVYVVVILYDYVYTAFWEKEKCCLVAYSPLSTMFSKGLFHRGMESCGKVFILNSLLKDKKFKSSILRSFAFDYVNVARIMLCDWERGNKNI